MNAIPSLWEIESIYPVGRDGEVCGEMREKCAEILRARGYSRVDTICIQPGQYVYDDDGGLHWLPKEEERDGV